MARRSPLRLYKYFPPERIDVLQNGRVRFTPPAVLNDPFEMSPSLVRKLMASDVERAGGMEEAFARFHDGFAADRRVAESMRSEVGVLSLAEVPDNLLMWAHYADQHRGFLIEFDPIHEFFRQRRSRTDEFHHVRPVRYTQERPVREISRFVDARTLLTKSVEWKYEREWRMLVHFPHFAHEAFRQRGQVVHLVLLPPACITGVVLGARMPGATRARFEQAAADTRYSHVTVRYAELDTARFKVVMPDGDDYFNRAKTFLDRALHGMLRGNATARARKAAAPLFRAAIADLSRALRISPSSMPYLVHRATAHQLLNELDAAIDDYTRALEVNTGSHADILYHLRGQLLARVGRFREAEQDLERIEDNEEAAQLLAAVRVLRERSQAAPA